MVSWVLPCDNKEKRRHLNYVGGEGKDIALECCVIFFIGTLILKRVKKQLHSTCK